MSEENGWIAFGQCPTCGAKAGEACRTPKGRKKEACHDTRPFGVWLTDGKEQKNA